MGLEAFPYEISRFSTNYDASNTNRSTNLAIAANKINGTVLMPGEEFSYNKVVGKRTVFGTGIRDKDGRNRMIFTDIDNESKGIFIRTSLREIRTISK